MAALPSGNERRSEHVHVIVRVVGGEPDRGGLGWEKRSQRIVLPGAGDERSPDCQKMEFLLRGPGNGCANDHWRH
jgi:hypothetical protein